MRHGSLFSGIGGFDLASEWMGWENVFHCEWNTFGQKVLSYYWPKAISYHDITKTDFSIHRGHIDIITGGFPCQPYSMAGKRKGKEDERHLWPEMLRCIREVQPTWVVGENVLGLVNWDGGLVFHEVQADLEAQGYEVQPYVLPAASINAPHRRDRVWFVAYSNNKRRSSGLGEVQSENGKVYERNNYAEFSDSSIQPVASNSSSSKLQGSKFHGSFRSKGETKNESRQFSRSICPTWEKFPTVSPICTRDDGISNRLDSITFSKWRAESIKAGGNAIVPQVVYQIFKTIQQYTDLTEK
jgi:DNA (cytosine-5)-methyltransferase 1